MSTAKILTRGEIESAFNLFADCISCQIHGGGSLEKKDVVSAWKAERRIPVADLVKRYPNEKREDIEAERQFFGDCAKTLEKIQGAHEEPDGLTFIYTIDPATVGKMRETAKLLNIPFKTFVRIHSDISFVFTCASEDHGLTFGHYVWPSREAAQKAIDQLAANFQAPYDREIDFAEGGEWRREKLVGLPPSEGAK